MGKWLLGITVTMIVGGVGLYVWANALIEEGCEPKADGTNTYAIILGAKVKGNGVPSLALKYRLDAAVEYLKQYPHVQVIVSGGQGKDEPISEASFMYTYLVEAGIKENRILQEDASTSTYENLQFSKELLPEDETAVTIISSDFHLARAQLLAKSIGLKTDVIATKTPKVVEQKLRLREKLALMKTILVGH